jgi:hypothetical protein
MYPYVVPASYLVGQPPVPDGMVLPLGHEVYTVLVEDCDGSGRNVVPAELEAAGLDADQAHALAVENLIRLARNRRFQAHLYLSPSNIPFMAWHGHWLIAACLRLPYLYRLAKKHLPTQQLCVSIPHPGAMVLFPMANRTLRDEMRALIREKEGGEPEPITWELFSLTPDGVSAFYEEEEASGIT